MSLRGNCQLYCGRVAIAALVGVDVCAECLELARWIADDAGVHFDEGLIAAVGVGRSMVKKAAPAKKRSHTGSRNKRLVPTRGGR